MLCSLIAILIARALAQNSPSSTLSPSPTHDGLVRVPRIQLLGRYIRAGVNSLGTLGSGNRTLPGIQYDSSGRGAFNDLYDYLIPGDPMEGWSVKYTESDGYTSIDSSNNNASPGSVTSQFFGITLATYHGIGYRGSTWDQRAVWSGTRPGLYAISHDMRFNAGDEVLRITTTISRSDPAVTEPLSDLYFGRYIDPDCMAAPGDSHNTTNTLGYAPIGPHNLVFSEAWASRYALGLMSAADNVGAGISSGWSRDPQFYYSGVDNGNGDYTIGLGWYVPTLAPGESAVFEYAYIFGPTRLAAGITGVASGAGGGMAGVAPGCTSTAGSGAASSSACAMPSGSGTATHSAGASGSKTPTYTGTQTRTGSKTPTDTPSSLRTLTSTGTPSASASRSFGSSPDETPSGTGSSSFSPSATLTPVPSPSGSATPSGATPSRSGSVSPSSTRAPSSSPSTSSSASPAIDTLYTALWPAGSFDAAGSGHCPHSGLMTSGQQYIAQNGRAGGAVQPQWAADVSGDLTATPLVDSTGRLIYSTSNNETIALDLRTGALLWRSPVAGHIALGPNGTVIVSSATAVTPGTFSVSLSALLLSSGAVAWSAQRTSLPIDPALFQLLPSLGIDTTNLVSDPVVVMASALRLDNAVILVGAGGSAPAVLMFDAHNGTVIGSFSLPGPSSTAGSSRRLAASFSHEFDSESKHRDARQLQGIPLPPNPSPPPSNAGTQLSSLMQQQLVAPVIAAAAPSSYSTASQIEWRAVAWHCQTTAGLEMVARVDSSSSGANVTTRQLSASSQSSIESSIGCASSIALSVRVASSIDSSLLPQLNSGSIAIVSFPDRIAAINSSSGSAIWSYFLDNRQNETAAAFAVDSQAGLIYASTSGAQILALDVRSGALQWNATCIVHASSLSNSSDSNNASSNNGAVSSGSDNHTLSAPSIDATGRVYSYAMQGGEGLCVWDGISGRLLAAISLGDVISSGGGNSTPSIGSGSGKGGSSDSYSSPPLRPVILPGTLLLSASNRLVMLKSPPADLASAAVSSSQGLSQPVLYAIIGGGAGGGAILLLLTAAVYACLIAPSGAQPRHRTRTLQEATDASADHEAPVHVPSPLQRRAVASSITATNVADDDEAAPAPAATTGTNEHQPRATHVGDSVAVPIETPATHQSPTRAQLAPSPPKSPNKRLSSSGKPNGSDRGVALADSVILPPEAAVSVAAAAPPSSEPPAATSATHNAPRMFSGALLLRSVTIANAAADDDDDEAAAGDDVRIRGSNPMRRARQGMVVMPPRRLFSAQPTTTTALSGGLDGTDTGSASEQGPVAPSGDSSRVGHGDEGAPAANSAAGATATAQARPAVAVANSNSVVGTTNGAENDCDAPADGPPTSTTGAATSKTDDADADGKETSDEIRATSDEGHGHHRHGHRSARHSSSTSRASSRSLSAPPSKPRRPSSRHHGSRDRSRSATKRESGS